MMKKNKSNTVCVYVPLYLQKDVAKKCRLALLVYEKSSDDLSTFQLYREYVKRFPDHFHYSTVRLDDYDYNLVNSICEVFGSCSSSLVLSFVLFIVFSGVSVLGGATCTQDGKTE